MALAIPFVSGLIIGSFLNVVGLRWNSGVPLSGRSGCPHCGKKLVWYELIPILSFLFLRGRCSQCHSKISLQYPLIEILTGLVFVTIFNFQFSIFKEFSLEFIVYCLLFIVISSIYIVILIYDFHHKIIPDSLVYSAIIVALIFRITTYYLLPATYYWDFLAGPIIFLFFALIWLFSRGRAMGFGDAKLGLSIGLLLGARAGFSAIILAFWIGASVMLLVMFFSSCFGLFNKDKKLTMKSEIPFAPFMILGAWISLIYELNLLQIL